MGPEFFQTIMGRQFYDGTLPRIAKALERIANALEETNKRAEAAVPDKEQVVLPRDTFEEAHAAVAFAVTQSGGGWLSTYNKMHEACNSTGDKK
jgi:hypothetical protein